MNGKCAVLREQLEQGMTFVIVDASRPGVNLPDDLLGDQCVRLNLGWRMDPPTDLEVSEWGVRARLSFGGRTHACAIPWSAVYVIGRVVFHDSAPQVVETPPPPRSGLHLVKN